jgi:NAD(P)-dependent dehydrogenase (short-subunit alcohol dehydrogenase family)
MAGPSDVGAALASEQLRFDGRIALVTGSGRGVGRCHALTLASRGAKVVVADYGGSSEGKGSSSEPANQVVEEITAAGGDAIACHASVSDEAGAASMVQAALDTWGGLDILINNAGIGDPERFEDQTTEQFRRMLDVQYLGTVFVAKAAWSHFVEAGRGRIVNTCSEGPLGIHGKMTSYGGAKGGVIGFTLALAAEAPNHGISVNGFSPRASTRLSAPDVMAKVYDVPAEHFETSMNAFPPELASPACVYLAHESCDLNGVILVCGGGQVLRLAFSENDGYRSEHMTVEDIATNIDRVIDMNEAQVVGLDTAAQAVSGQQTGA